MEYPTIGRDPLLSWAVDVSPEDESGPCVIDQDWLAFGEYQAFVNILDDEERCTPLLDSCLDLDCAVEDGLSSSLAGIEAPHKLQCPLVLECFIDELLLRLLKSLLLLLYLT